MLKCKSLSILLKMFNSSKSFVDDDDNEQIADDVTASSSIAVNISEVRSEKGNASRASNLPKAPKAKKYKQKATTSKNLLMPNGNWNTINEADTVPLQRAFAPKRQPGFQLPATQTWSLFDLFSLFISQLSVQEIVNNTNQYATCVMARRKSFKWEIITANELTNFIAQLIFMGMVDIPAMNDYWNRNNFFGEPFMLTSGLTRRRFLNILSALHLCDLETDDSNERKKANRQDYDPLTKVKPLMTELQESCRSFFVRGQNVSIDERMVASKGRLGMKQYMRDKPVKWGFMHAPC